MYSLGQDPISSYFYVYSCPPQQIRYLYCPSAGKCEAETYKHGVPRLWKTDNDTATPQLDYGDCQAYLRQDFTQVKRIWFDGNRVCRMEYDNGKRFDFSNYRDRTASLTAYNNWNCPEPQCHLMLDIFLGKKSIFGYYIYPIRHPLALVDGYLLACVTKQIRVALFNLIFCYSSG